MVRLASEVVVPGVGPQDAKIALIGEAPAEVEVREGQPFMGPAGKVLNDLLAEVGMKREEVYIDNVVQQRPKDNKFSEFYDRRKINGRTVIEQSELLVRSIAALNQRLLAIKPNVVVALGKEPLKCLSGDAKVDNISDWRGSVIKTDSGLKMLPTYHPSYIIRAWEDRPIAAFDLARAKRESSTPTSARRLRRVIFNISFEETKKRLEAMGKEAKFISFDIETNPPKRIITSIALSDSPEYALVIPISFKGRTYWKQEEESQLRTLVADILCDPSISKIAQNGQYDMIWLKDKWGIDVGPLYMDTMVAHSLHLPEYEKSLAFQCSIYTDIPYYKWEGKAKETPEMYWHYNGMDACATFECAMKIQEHLEKDGLWEFYNKLPHKLLAPLREMSLRGILVNQPLREEMSRANQKEQDELIKAIREEKTIQEYEQHHVKRKARQKIIDRWRASRIKCDNAGKSPKGAVCIKYPNPDAYVRARAREIPDFNPNSPAQLVGYFYTYRKWKPILIKRSDGKLTPTANSMAIKKLLAMYHEPVLDSLLDLHDLVKEMEFLSAKLEANGRLHCSYDITGTETGRLSSKRYVYDTGANLQNQPAGKRKDSKLRRVFVPDAGKVFVQCDLKQAEAWIVAYLSADPFFMDAVRSSDIHRHIASLIFRKGEGDINARERDLAKRCVHALNYGMGPWTFAEEAEISNVEARTLRNKYFAAFPKLGMWHARIEAHMRHDRTLRTPFGRVRNFAKRLGEKLFKEAWAYIPQSTVGDLLNLGFLDFWGWLKKVPTEVEDLAQLGYGKQERLLERAPGGYKVMPYEVIYDCQIMLQIHDSLIVQCPPQHARLIAARLKGCLERPITVNGHEITIPCDEQVGDTWYDLEDIEIWKAKS